MAMNLDVVSGDLYIQVFMENVKLVIHHYLDVLLPEVYLIVQKLLLMLLMHVNLLKFYKLVVVDIKLILIFVYPIINSFLFIFGISGITRA